MARLFRFVIGKRVLWTALLLDVLAAVAFAWFDQARPAASSSAVALQLAFSATAFQRIVEQWGQAGVEAYRAATLYADSWFPVAYSVSLASVTAHLLARVGVGPVGRWRSAIALPFAAAVLDWVENSLHLVLLHGRPDQPSSLLVAIASTAAVVKWGLLAISLLVIVLLILRAAGRLLAHRSR